MPEMARVRRAEINLAAMVGKYVRKMMRDFLRGRATDFTFIARGLSAQPRKCWVNISGNMPICVRPRRSCEAKLLPGGSLTRPFQVAPIFITSSQRLRITHLSAHNSQTLKFPVTIYANGDKPAASGITLFIYKRCACSFRSTAKNKQHYRSQ